MDDTAAGTFGFAYDAGTGNLASMTRPNSITDQFSFDPDGRLTARDAVNGSGTTVDEANYTYNTAGLRATLTDLAGVHDYSYDPDGHLTGVDNPDGGSPDESYTYDASGNLTSWPNNPTAQVKHNTADQLTQDATNTYSYDNEGNQVTKRNRTTGDTTTYTWNAAHQLTKITNPDGSSVAYGYGPLGRRLTATTTPAGGGTPSTKAFVWAVANLRATLDTTGALVNRNITTPDLNGTLAVTTPTGTTYPLKDGLGSATATTDQAGAVTSTTAYTAYGISTITSGSATSLGAIAGYTGHQTDPGGLIYARARYYNPQTGTFLSEDPVPSVNPYQYSSNSPVNRIDPTGRIDIIGYSVGTAQGVKGTAGVADLVSLMGIASASEASPSSEFSCHTHLAVATFSFLIGVGSMVAPTSGTLAGLSISMGLLGEILDATGPGSQDPTAVLSSGLLTATSAALTAYGMSIEEQGRIAKSAGYGVGALGLSIAAQQMFQYSKC